MEMFTVKNLRSIAKQNNIRDYSKLPKSELIASLGNKFWSCFFCFDFLVFLDVFWCAESENDVSFFVVSVVFL